MTSKLLIAVLIISVFPLLSYAQQKALTTSPQASVPARGAYVDANNNGICDYYEGSGTSYGYRRAGRNAAAPANGRGMAAGQARGAGQGNGWRRNMPTGQGRGLGPAKGWGRGLGPGQGQGMAPGGRYFVDSDNNGICDTYEKTGNK